MGMFDAAQGMFADPSGFGGNQGGLASILGDYLRSVMSGQIAASGPLAQNNYDPQRSFAQNALDPRAIENAANIGLGMGTGPIKAYHYSPQDFVSFDLSKAGSATDPGLMGRALYFSTDPAVVKAGPHRYEVNLNVKAPLSLEHAPDWRTSTKSDLAGEALGIPPPQAGMLAVGEKSPSLPEWQRWAESIATEAKSRGHDAAVLDYSPTGYGHREIAVYDPSIIEILRKYGILGPVAAPMAMAPFAGEL